jgi:hypothetical protein
MCGPQCPGVYRTTTVLYYLVAVILAEDNYVQPTVSWTLQDYFHGVAVTLAEDICVLY